MTTTNIEKLAAAAPMTSSANSAGILRYLTLVGLAFLALMVTLEPDVGFSAPPAARLLFWALQIAVGLVILQSVLYLLTRRFGASRLPSWALVLLSGVLGSIVLAPLYWLIGEGLMQGWLGYPERSDADSDDLLGAAFSHPLLREYLEIVGPVTAGWALICMPRLHWLVPPMLHVRTEPAAEVQPPAAESASASANAGSAVVRADSSAAGPSASVPEPISARPFEAGKPTAVAIPTEVLLPRDSWCERLPTELGTDVIAVASELQYLRVWTSRGCALILGALGEVESQGAEHGLRVHRSWWVSREHVVSVRRTATGTVCLMSNGREVPVSRRRSAEVLARFGDGVRYRAARASEAVAQTDLN